MSLSWIELMQRYMSGFRARHIWLNARHVSRAPFFIQSLIIFGSFQRRWVYIYTIQYTVPVNNGAANTTRSSCYHNNLKKRIFVSFLLFHILYFTKKNIINITNKRVNNCFFFHQPGFNPSVFLTLCRNKYV